MADDDDDDTIKLGKREADSLLETYLTAQDLESAVMDFLEQDNSFIQQDDDSIQLGNREADSLSETYLTMQDLESSIMDFLEQDNSLIQPLTPEVSRSQEDEELDGDLSTPETVASDSSEVIPRAAVETTSSDRNMDTAKETDSPTPSIEKIFRNSLISNPEFAIEKVLGEATANILTEAEAEASKIAEWDSETDLTEPHSILTCRVCQLFVRTVDRLLDKSDELREHYLPLTEEEIGNLKTAVEEMDEAAADHQMQACLSRINNLSSKLRQRAYMMALSKLRMARRNTQENIFQLHQAIDLIGQVQQEDDPQSHHSYRKLSAITVEWTHRHSIVAPLAFAHETNLHVEREEIGTPLAHNSFVDEPEIPIIEKIRIPIVEISHVEDEEEVDSYAETPEEQDTMTPPTEMSLEEVTPTFPLEIDIPKVTPTLPLEINVPEVTPTPPIPRIHSVKAASPLDKRIRRDMANVTVTAPGCDEESTPSLKTRQIFGEEGDIPPSEMEAQALEMSRSLAYNLQDTYENLLVHLQDLPVHLQQKLYQTCQRMAKLRSDFDSAQSFEDLSHDFLSKSFEIMDEAQGSLDELMEYALQSPKALLWLKDHLPVPEEGEEERVLGTEGAFPIEGEADPLDIQMTAEKRSILIIQQTYDPKGCDNDTLPGKEKEVTSSPRKQDSEDILKTLQTYEPKGCDDEIPSNKQKEEVSPSSKQDWNIMKTLQGYVPKLSENKGFSSEDQEETPPSMKDEEEVREVDILKLQRAHDPKGCDDGVEIVAPPASEQELQDILIVQRAYDPKECYEGAPPEEEKVAPPSGKWEREGILQIQQAYDPKGCDDEIPSNKEKEEVSPSSKQDWNILKTLQGYVPKLSENKGFTSEDQEEIPPSMKDEEEVREVDILKLQRAHDPKGCDDGVEIVAPPASEQELQDILIVQRAYDPKECYEGAPPEEKVAPPSGKWEREGILQIQQAYDPKGCDDKIPSNKEKEEVSPSSKQDWNILKTLQGYVPKLSENKGFSSEDQEEIPSSMKDEEEVREVDILKLQRAHDPKGCDDDVEIVAPPASEQELQDILIVQRAYDPKDCYEGAPPEEKVAPPSGKWEREGILQIQQAYDPKECDDEIPSNKQKEEVSPSSKQEWNILKTLQGYVPKLSENKGFSSEDKEETPPSMKDEEVREVDILKLQRAHDPKGCDDGVEIVVPPASEQELQDILIVQRAYDPKDCYEGAPPEEEKVAPPSSKWEREGILQIQQAYDPKECDDEPPPRREDATPSSKPVEWNLMKMFQAYVPKGSTDEAPSGKEKKEAVLPHPEKQVTKERSILKHHSQSSNDKGVLFEKKEKVQPSSTQVGNILKIQEMYDPKGCDEGFPSRKEKEEVVRYSGKAEDILKIQEMYDPKGCDEGSPSRKEKEEVVRSSGKTEDILKIQEMYDPKGCDEGSPSKKEKEEVVRSSGKAEDILKIQQAYDPKGCDDETPSRTEKKEVRPSGKQEEWTIMKFFQSYIPKSRSDEAPAVKVATPPPAKQEVKEVVPPARHQETKEWDILKIQKAYDPQGCKDEDN